MEYLGIYLVLSTDLLCEGGGGRGGAGRWLHLGERGEGQSGHPDRAPAPPGVLCVLGSLLALAGFIWVLGQHSPHAPHFTLFTITNV